MSDRDTTKAVRFNCDAALLKELDMYRSRFRCRTQLIEEALRGYLAHLRKIGARKGDWQ